MTTKAAQKTIDRVFATWFFALGIVHGLLAALNLTSGSRIAGVASAVLAPIMFTIGVQRFKLARKDQLRASGR